jgi:PAS domain S-box-containing protein
VPLRSPVRQQYTAAVRFTVRWRRPSFDQGLKHDLIRQTAYFFLVLRVLEGLAGWILFNEVFLPAVADAWVIHAVIVLYFVGNSLLCLRYRAGQITRPIILADLALNLGVITLLAGCTGGVASPVVLISLFKIAGYAFVFSPRIGFTSILVTLVGFICMVLGEQFGWWSTVPIDVLPPGIERQIEFVFRVCVLGTTLVGAMWLFNQVAEKEREVGTEAKRAKDAAEREHAAASVAGALFAVSEAVSRLTSLHEILNKVVDLAPRVLAVDYCGILLWSEDNAAYRGAAVSGVEPAVAAKFTGMRLAPADAPDLEWVRRLGHCAVIAPRGSAAVTIETPMLLTAPLMSGGRFYGVLQFARRGGQSSFTQRDFTIADGIAGQTAVALERARLVEESLRLVRAVESTGEAVLITDRNRRVVFVNQAFLQTFGYSRAEVMGQDALRLGGATPDEWVRDVERDLLEKNWRGEAVVRRKDGTTFAVALNTSLIRSEDNRIQGAVVILEDVSTQKKLQEQLHYADRLAAAGELAAGVAHEVNNALVGILGQVEAAHHATDVDTLQTAMACVELQGRRIAEIVQGLLGFARPQPPERGPVDLRSLVRETLTLMAHDLGRSRIRSETRFAPDLPLVMADAKQIQQVLVNLFTNATQAMEPHGGGMLVVSLGPGAGVVRMDVQDNGVGIAPEAIPRVFDPFFSTKAKGTGLGLSVSYAIARTHGGDLTVRTAPSEGTTFTLTLPAVSPVQTGAAHTVLLVDDDPAVAETLADMLTREGLTVQRAATGSEALAALAQGNFDAIFLDVRLPDISGREVYTRLATERPDVARRVIFVTGGLWHVESRGLREKLPAQPTLSKPCTAAQIREALRLLRDTRAAA